MQSIDSLNIINYNNKYLKYKYKYLLLNQSLSKDNFKQLLGGSKISNSYGFFSKIPNLFKKQQQPPPTKTQHAPVPNIPPQTYPTQDLLPHLYPTVVTPLNPPLQNYPYPHPTYTKQIVQNPTNRDDCLQLYPYKLTQIIKKYKEEIFDLLLTLHTQNKDSEIILVVPANAGQPWGGIGNKIYSDFYMWICLHIKNPANPKIKYNTEYASKQYKKDFNTWMEKNLQDKLKLLVPEVNYYQLWLNLHSKIFSKYDDFIKFDLKVQYKEWLNYIHDNLVEYSKYPKLEKNIQFIKKLIYEYRLFMSTNAIKINLNKNFNGGGLEEAIIIKWMNGDKHIYNKINSENNMYPEWGLYLFSDHTLYNPSYIIQERKISKQKLSPLTIQDIDYTSNTKDKYNTHYKYKAILDINRNNVPVTLLFIFTPNFNKGELGKYPSLDATVEPDTHNNLDYKKTALTAILNTIFNSDTTNKSKKIYILPHIGSNINKCNLSPIRDTDRNEFYKLVQNTIKPQLVTSEIYVVF